MIKKAYDYISTHGIILMIGGFVIAIVSLLVYMQTRFYGSALPKISFGCTITGFVIYVIGRFFVATHQRRKRPVTSQDASTDGKEKSKE
jgi:branched-subunit amino acid ABC-type transport system permease component